MLSKLKTITTSTAIYGFGGISNQLLSVLLVPIYTRAMPVDEYGMLTFFDLTSSVLSLITVLGLISALYRYLPESEREGHDRELVSTVFWYMTAVGVLLSGLAFVFARQLAVLVFDSARYELHMRLIIISSMAFTNGSFYFGMLQYRRKALLFTIIIFFRTLLGLGLNVYLVAYAHQGVLGVLWSTLTCNVLALAALMWIARREVGWRLAPSRLPRLLRFGSPLIISQVGSYLLSYTGVYYLREHVSMTEVGYYGLAMKFSRLIMILVVNPFDQAWNPIKFRLAQDPDHRALFARIFDYLIIVAALMGLALSLFARDAIAILATRDYLPAARLVPLLCLSSVLFGAYRVSTLGSELAEKTSLRSTLVLLAGLLNLALNSLLTPWLGVSGVLASVNAAYFALFATTLLHAQHCYHIPYKYTRLLLFAAAIGGIYAASLLLPAGRLFSILVKLSALAALPVVIWYSGFLRPEERRGLGRIVAALRGRFA